MQAYGRDNSNDGTLNTMRPRFANHDAPLTFDVLSLYQWSLLKPYLYYEIHDVVLNAVWYVYKE
jgi:hypothetical protein